MLRFMNIVVDSMELHTSESRDHIFSIIKLDRRSLRWGEIPEWLKPDYTKFTADVIRDATIFGLLISADLDFLKLISHRLTGCTHQELPSWVPGWSQGFDHKQDAAPLRSDKFEASLNVHLNPAETRWDHENELTVADIVIHTVKYVSMPLRGDVLNNMFEAEVSETFALAFTDRATPLQLAFSHVALGITLTAGCDHRAQRYTNVCFDRSLKRMIRLPLARESLACGS